MNLQSFQTLENNIISEVLCSSGCGLYGVKHCTVSNSKCAMPFLSCLLFFIPSLYLSFFNSKNFLFSSLPSFFMQACIHRRQGAKAPKKLSFFQIKGKVSIWTLHNYKLTRVFIA